MKKPALSLLFILTVTIIVVAAPVTVPAKQDLAEHELDQTTAAGSDFPVIGSGVSPLSSSPGSLSIEDVASPGRLSSAPILVLNNVVGENEVITRLFIEFVGAGIPTPGQENVVSQRVGDGDNREGAKNGRLVIDPDLTLRELALRDLLGLVVNNVFGANRVETLINVQVGGGNQGGTPFRAPGETAASAGSASAQNSPVKTGADPTFSIPTPMTVPGAITLLESLVPKMPELASDLAELRRVDQVQSRLQSRFSTPTPTPTSTSQQVK